MVERKSDFNGQVGGVGGSRPIQLTMRTSLGSTRRHLYELQHPSTSTVSSSKDEKEDDIDGPKERHGFSISDDLFACQTWTCQPSGWSFHHLPRQSTAVISSKKPRKAKVRRRNSTWPAFAPKFQLPDSSSRSRSRSRSRPPPDVQDASSSPPPPPKRLNIDSLTAVPSSCWILLILYCTCLCLGTRVVVAFDCDFIRVSNEDGIKNGSFTAPLLNGHPIPPQGIQCIYTFIALPTERVKITFRDFNLAGRPPECFHEYVDLYTELRNSTEDLVQTDKFGGRFCGRVPPRPRISLYNTIVIVFSSSSDRHLQSHFAGTYEFINGSIYDMGVPAASPFTCNFVVKSWVKRLGDLVSPTYPGVYPQRIMCTYQLLGQRGQRVRVEFMDFDLFFGGLHCPYDRLMIYDGPTEQDPIIDAYCGPKRNLVVFSSQENLFISFITNRSGGENRGFHAIFEFSELFVNLEFITGEHLRGTECDQRILSHGRNSGIIKSPNSPFPYLPNVECKYLIEGLNNADDLERVKINVETFHMPQLLGAVKGDCSGGGLFIWLNGRDDKGPPHRSLCGTHTPQDTVISKDSKLLLKFSSGATQGLGFTIRYEFETFFGVPGTPHPVTTTCEFLFQSASSKEGEFNSPRHPSNYPSNHNCTYIFEGDGNEQAHVEFELFKLDGNGTTAHTCDNMDHLDVFEVVDLENGKHRNKEIGRYCGVATPAPVKTSYGAHTIKMHLVTDAAGVTNGFRGRYWFDKEIPTFHADRGCGGVISNASFGTITSPNFGQDKKYPADADCEWHIKVRPGHFILINVTSFILEGDQPASGCPGAALKIYTDPDKYPTELCGQIPPVDTTRTTPPPLIGYRSISNTMKLRFVSAKKATGAAGFELTWNEAHYAMGTKCEANEFFCEKNLYCIDGSLKCDEKKNNCGEGDLSDESPETCGTGGGSFLGLSHTVIGSVAGAVGAVVIAVIVLAVCLCRRRSRARRRKQQQMQQQGSSHQRNDSWSN